MRVHWLFAAAVALVACAGRPPEMPAQGGEHEAAPPDEPASPTAPSASSDSARRATAGDLVCRTVTTGGAATELFLEWDGNEAHGVLRETAPSGMVHEKKVHAERQQGLVVADDINEKDLVIHAAVVAERNGKKVMKVEDAWSSCQ